MKSHISEIELLGFVENPSPHANILTPQALKAAMTLSYFECNYNSVWSYFQFNL